MTFAIREMLPADYLAVIALMRHAPGVSLRGADSPSAVARFLERNPGLSLVAETDDRLVACLLAGHDGRRGYLHHLAVVADCRRQGVATALVERCLDAFAQLGIHKTHIDVYRDNATGIDFWQAAGWQRRDDIHRFSAIRGADDDV